MISLLSGEIDHTIPCAVPSFNPSNFISLFLLPFPPHSSPCLSSHNSPLFYPFLSPGPAHPDRFPLALQIKDIIFISVLSCDPFLPVWCCFFMTLLSPGVATGEHQHLRPFQGLNCLLAALRIISQTLPKQLSIPCIAILPTLPNTCPSSHLSVKFTSPRRPLAPAVALPVRTLPRGVRVLVSVS